MSSSELLFRLIFRFFCLLSILSVEFDRVDGAPTAATRVPSDINKRASTAKSSSDARLLGGRLSLMAGLGSSAHHHRLPLIPYGNHQVNDVERISSSSSSSSPLYKLPLAHSGWAPYLAAIYEPPPLYSLFQDPLGYLAALLSPSVDWFTGGDSRTAADFFESTTSPMMVVGTSSSGNENDIVVVFDDSDNEIPDDGRKLLKTDGLFEGRMDKFEDAGSSGSSTSATEATKTTTVTTNSIVSEKNTVAPTESIRRQDAGETSRVTTTTTTANSQSGSRRPAATQPINNNNRRPGDPIISSNGGRPTGPLKPMKRPPGRPTTTSTTQDPTDLSTIQDQSDGLADADYDPTDTPAATTTTTTMMTTAANSTTRPATTNTTTSGYHDGYYYYGHRTQNVSHVVFTTTPRAETMQPSTESLVPLNLGGGGNGGDTDRFFGQQQQQQGPIYQDYDYQSPIARFDYYNHEEQQPPIEYTYPHHHHQHHHHDQPANNHVANEHLHQSQERYLNGFRPSVPYYVFK